MSKFLGEDLGEIAEASYEAALQEQGKGGEDSDDKENQDNSADDSGEGQEHLQDDTDQDDSDSDQDDDDSDSEDSDDDSGDGSDDSDGDSDDGDSDDSDKSDELSDEELIALAEKRGLKLAKDEAKQQEKQQSIERPEEIPAHIWNNMPEVNRYVYSQLPYITTYDENGNEFVVKTSQQLPAGFKFADDKTRIDYLDAINAQGKRAEKLLSEIQSNAKEAQEAESRQQESKMVVDDVEKLQKDGLMPKPTAKFGTPEFDNDPAVVQINKVLAFWQQRRQEGRPLSVYDAGLVYRQLHPKEFEKPAAKGDAERKKVSKKISGGGQADSKSAKKNPRPKFPIGTSASDIADYYSQDLD